MCMSVDYDDLFKSVLGSPSMEQEEDPNPSKEALYADLFDSVINNISNSSVSVPSLSQFEEQPSDQLFKKLVTPPGTKNNDKPATPDASGDEEPVQELANFAPKAPKKVKYIAQRKNVLKPKKLTMNEAGPNKKTTNVTKCKTVFKSMKNVVLELQRKRIEDADGTWVQCCNHNCLKFRYLEEVKEPIQVPSKWYCSMSKDPRYNSCEATEENHRSNEDIFLKYIAGSIVWAKMAGYPPWPAMVDDDPDILQFFWTNELSETPTHYHVVFLDDKVSRAWISTGSIEPFSFDQKFHFSTMVCGKEYKHKMKPAIVKANQAMDMSIKERLLKFSFVQNYTGAWPPCTHSDVAHPSDNDLSESPETVDNEQIANLNNSYLEQAEIMLSQLSDLEASFEITASQQLSREKDKKVTKSSKKTAKQLNTKKKTEKEQPDKLHNIADNYLEIAEVMLSELDELEASFETTMPEKTFKVPQKSTKEPKHKETDQGEHIVDFQVLGASQSGMKGAMSKLASKNAIEEKQEMVKVIRKRSKSSTDKTAENVSMKKVKKRSASVDIVSNKRTNAAFDGSNDVSGNHKNDVELKKKNKKSFTTSVHLAVAGKKKITPDDKTNQPSAKNKVKPIFQIKRKSIPTDPDGKKSKDAASAIVSRAKASQDLQSKVLKPAFAIKKGVKSPELKLSQGSQDLFSESPVGSSQANNEMTSTPKEGLEFNIDLLFKNSLGVSKEE